MPQALDQIYRELVEVADNLESPALDGIVKKMDAFIQAEDDRKAAKGWKRGQGKIRFENGDLIADVYRNPDYPGVIIHRRYGCDNQPLPGWSISHEGTGKNLNSNVYPNMAKGVRTVLRYLADVNWDRPVAEILRDPKTKEAYNKLKTAR